MFACAKTSSVNKMTNKMKRLNSNKHKKLFTLVLIVYTLQSGCCCNRPPPIVSVKKNTTRSDLVCLDDFEAAARRVLTPNALIFYRPGADEEITLHENRLAFRRLIIHPRMLQNVSNRNLSVMILGKPASYPVGVSPTALQKMANSEGEIATFKAAQATSSIAILSTMSTTKLEDVAKAAPNTRKWFQIYILRNRTLTTNIVQRAVAAGFEALVFSIDCPVVGKRRETIRRRFVLPSNLSLAILNEGEDSNETTLYSINKLLDDSLTWKDVTWLKSLSSLPVIVKGVLTPEDAELAIEAGVVGIIVSNHGGRQLDTVSATIDALPKIIEQVKGRCEVYMDGGVRTGTDVFKALALGANMVFLGRPLIYGLAVNGEAGATAILNIIKDEFNQTMALAGASSVDQIGKQYVSRIDGLQCPSH